MSANSSSAVEHIGRRFSDRWAIIGVFAVFVALWAYTLIAIRPLPLDEDAALFLHAGWYINHGARLYIDIWDPKPPLTIETSAVLAWLSGGNLHTQYALGLLANMAGYAGLVLLVGAITLHYTDSYRASYTASVIFLLLAVCGFFPFPGYRIKSITLSLGLLGVHLHFHKRPFWSGVSVAASVGFWQPSIIFVLAVFVHQALEKEPLWPLVCGASTITIILLPIALWQAIPAMLEEAILSHFQYGESQALVVRGLKLIYHIRTGAAVVVLGLYVLLREMLRKLSHYWLLAFVSVWFIVLVVVFDYDGSDDLLSLVVIASIGIGLMVSCLPARQATILVAAAVLIVIGGVNMRVPTPSPRMASMYWNQEMPNSCHYRLSALEEQWIEQNGMVCPNG